MKILGSQLAISLENAILVADLKRQSAELEKKNAALNELDRLKDEFLAMTSHEFRTPLNGVIGMTALLKDTLLNNEQKDYVENICESADSLLALVTSVLDLSKLQAQKMKLEDKVFVVTECIESSIDMVEHQANTKNLNIAYFIDSNTPELLLGDRSRLKSKY